VWSTAMVGRGRCCGAQAGGARVENHLCRYDAVRDDFRHGRAGGGGDWGLAAAGRLFDGGQCRDRDGAAEPRAAGRAGADRLFNAGADLPERAALRPGQQARVRSGELADIVANELKPVYLAVANRVEEDTLLKQVLFDMALGLGPEVLCRQSEALRTRAGGRGVLAAVTRPVLMLAGAEDTVCA
jgi:hypothetical protein